MAYSVNTIKDLINLGGNLIITTKYSPNSLKDFTRLAKKNNTKLTIIVNKLSPNTVKELIIIGQDSLTLEV